MRHLVRIVVAIAKVRDPGGRLRRDALFENPPAVPLQDGPFEVLVVCTARGEYDTRVNPDPHAKQTV